MCPAESFWQRPPAVLSWLKHFVGVFCSVPKGNFSHPINKRRRAETSTVLLLLAGADYSQGLQDRTLPVLLGRLVKMERIWKPHQGRISTARSHRFKKPNQRAHPMRAFISFLLEMSHKSLQIIRILKVTEKTVSCCPLLFPLCHNQIIKF